MIRDKVIVSRYTDAYVGYALPQIGLDALVADMRQVRLFIRESPELMEFLRVPGIPFTDKTRFIEEVLGRGLTRQTTDFIRFLIQKKRIEHLDAIAERVRVVYSRGDVVDIVVRSTFPLELDVLHQIRDKMSRRTGKAVNLFLEFDPDLLGGLQIIIGNRILDGTVRSKLNDLKNQLLKAQVGQ